jgi:hypothetical protein
MEPHFVHGRRSFGREHDVPIADRDGTQHHRPPTARSGRGPQETVEPHGDWLPVHVIPDDRLGLLGRSFRHGVQPRHRAQGHQRLRLRTHRFRLHEVPCVRSRRPAPARETRHVWVTRDWRTRVSLTGSAERHRRRCCSHQPTQRRVGWAPPARKGAFATRAAGRRPHRPPKTDGAGSADCRWCTQRCGQKTDEAATGAWTGARPH